MTSPSGTLFHLVGNNRTRKAKTSCYMVNTPQNLNSFTNSELPIKGLLEGPSWPKISLRLSMTPLPPWAPIDTGGHNEGGWFKVSYNSGLTSFWKSLGQSYNLVQFMVTLLATCVSPFLKKGMRVPEWYNRILDYTRKYCQPGLVLPADSGVPLVIFTVQVGHTNLQIAKSGEKSRYES